MSVNARDVLLLKAAIEFGSECTYAIKKGGLGLTLIIDAGTRERARKMRKKIPSRWENLYTLVIFCTAPVDYDDL